MEQIKRISVVHQVEEQIEELIKEKQYLPDTKLPSEMELCKTLGVSRGTVREAFHYLQAKGVIELKAGKGAYVALKREPDNPEAISWLVENEKDLHNIIELRAAIEPLAAKLTAENSTDEIGSSLKAIQADFIQSATPLHYEKLAQLDEDFHHIIAINCGNSLLSEIILKIEESLVPFRQNTFKVRQNIQNTIEPHQHIINAIISHDAAKAEKEMKKHIVLISDNLCLNISSSFKN